MLGEMKTLIQKSTNIIASIQEIQLKSRRECLSYGANTYPRSSEGGTHRARILTLMVRLD